MPRDPERRYSEDECHAFFAELFPRGLAGDDILAELAPDGWENSPLNAVFHPSPERLHEEAARMHENIEHFVAARREAADQPQAKPPPEPSNPPTLDQIRADHQPQPVEPQRELRELLGMCLWDVFSDNHEVVAPDGRLVDLGSFRAAGGFLAEVANRELGHDPGTAEARDLERLQKMVGINSVEALLKSLEEQAEAAAGAHRVYGYMDFYLGTRMVAGRADLAPVYRLIFRRLRASGCDWKYHFPRLFLADLRPLHDALKEDETAEPEWTNYDPAAAFAEEKEESDRDEEIARMRAELDESHRQAVEAARDAPPPTTVAAYQQVFGHPPEGWPPEVED